MMLHKGAYLRLAWLCPSSGPTLDLFCIVSQERRRTRESRCLVAPRERERQRYCYSSYSEEFESSCEGQAKKVRGRIRAFFRVSGDEGREPYHRRALAEARVLAPMSRAIV